MANQRITVKRLREWGQCHSDEWARRKFGGASWLSLTTILRMESVSPEDRIWVATRPGVLSDRQRDRWLEMTVERAIRRSLGRSGCPVWETWAQRWLDGTDRSRGAAEAAWAAVWAAEAAAAWAADAAVWAASWATLAAEYKQQITDLLTVLGGE